MGRSLAHEAGLVLQSTRNPAIVGASEHTGREKAGFRDAAEALMLLFHGGPAGADKSSEAEARAHL